LRLKIINNQFVANCPQNASVKILKIGYHLAKIIMDSENVGRFGDSVYKTQLVGALWVERHRTLRLGLGYIYSCCDNKYQIWHRLKSRRRSN